MHDFAAIAGVPIKEKRLGHVADFCPLCRGVQPFELMQVFVPAAGIAGQERLTADNRYFVSDPDADLPSHTRRCQNCRVSYTADALKYENIAKRNPEALDELITLTQPNVRKVYEARMALEERVRTAPHALTPETRGQLLAEPFRLLSPEVESRFGGQGRFDLRSGIACVVTVVSGLVALCAVGVHYADLRRGAKADRFLWMALAFWLPTLVYAIWEMLGAGRRYIERRIVPQLARTLSPLNPTPEELEAILSDYRQAGSKIGIRVSPQALAQCLASSPAAAIVC
jgi:hypothetical protein